MKIIILKLMEVDIIESLLTKKLNLDTQLRHLNLDT